jgi:hypothetical protein
VSFITCLVCVLVFKYYFSIIYLYTT